MDWAKLDKEADYVTQNTIRQEPGIAKRYYDTLNTHKLRDGEIFVSLCINEPQKVFFMSLKSEPKRFITFEGKSFKLKDRVHIKTDNYGVQTVHFYEESEQS